MEHITDEILTESVNQMEPRFDSHSLITYIRRNYQTEYAKELCRYSDQRYPLTQLHSVIANKVKSLGLATPIRDIKTENINHDITDNKEWERRENHPH